MRTRYFTSITTRSSHAHVAVPVLEIYHLVIGPHSLCDRAQQGKKE